MRWLVISDTHFTHHFNPRRYAALESLITKMDRVIINGDFFDGVLSSFNAFCASPWSRLFPLLKHKGTIYIFGNHDPKSLSDLRIKQFSILQTDKYLLRTPQRKYHLEHGDRVTRYKPFRNTPWWRRYYKVMDWAQTALEIPLFYGAYLQRTPVYTWMNKPLREFAVTLPSDTWFVAGHTHAPEYRPSSRFINTGGNRTGVMEYLTIDTNNAEPELFTGRV